MHINLSATDQYRVTNMIKWDKLTTAQRTAKRRERKKKDKLARANRRLQKIQRRGS
jgi:predicted  nucleic acid-binding Zn-ribbon protein